MGTWASTGFNGDQFLAAYQHWNGTLTALFGTRLAVGTCLGNGRTSNQLTLSKKRGGVEESDLYRLLLEDVYSFAVFPLPFPEGLPVVLG
jgi:hypothetical protein